MSRTAPAVCGCPNDSRTGYKCDRVRDGAPGRWGAGPHKGPAPCPYRRSVRKCGLRHQKIRTTNKCCAVRVRIMKRPKLRQIPLAEGILRPGEATVTVSVGQWDAIHQAAYDAGCLLLELDDDEQPVALYQSTGRTASTP